jgi:hypothetical protein
MNDPIIGTAFGIHNTDVQNGVIYFLQGLPGDAS